MSSSFLNRLKNTLSRSELAIPLNRLPYPEIPFAPVISKKYCASSSSKSSTFALEKCNSLFKQYKDLK